MAIREVIAALRQTWISCIAPQWLGGSELQLTVSEDISFDVLRELQAGDILHQVPTRSIEAAR